jgi:luciferase family oxidoreductase group 1
VRVSVLDTVPLGPEMSARDAITATLQVGQFADSAGFHRIWVSEHHASTTSACAQPAILVGLLAERTSGIRVGAGGVMLPNHNTLAVAEQFALLSTCYGDRIDLGLGRAAGAEPPTLRAVGRRAEGASDEGFLSDLTELSGFLTGRWPSGHPYADIPAVCSVKPPPIHLLGASVGSATLAGRAGYPYAFGRNLAARLTTLATAAYRRAWTEGGHPGEPPLTVCCGVFCADTQAEADQAALVAALIRLRVARSQQGGPTLSHAELTDPSSTEQERAHIMQSYAASGYLIGDPERVAAGLRVLAARSGARELMLASKEFSAADRIRTLAAVAAGLTSSRPVVI